MVTMNSVTNRLGVKLKKVSAMAQDVDVNVKVTGLDKAAKEVNKVEESTSDLGSSFGQLESAADKFTGGAVSGLRAAAQGTKAFIKGLKLTRTALIATGIGAVVLSVTALVAAFTKTQRGAEMLEKVTAGLGAAFDVITDIAAGLGEAIVNAFLNPVEAIQGFAETVKTYVTDQIQNIIDGLGLLGKSISLVFEGEWSAAADAALEGTKKLGEGVTRLNPLTAGLALAVDGVVKVVNEVAPAMAEAATAASKLSAASIQLRKDQRDLQLEFAEGRAQIKEYNLIAEDTTRTLEERLEAAQKAIDIEKGLMSERQRLAEEEVRIQKETMALSESTEEDQQRLVDLEAALINIRTESAEMQTTLNNKLNIIRDQALAEEEARFQRSEELDAAMQTEREAEYAAIVADYEAKFALADEFGRGEAELREMQKAELAAIDKKYADIAIAEQERLDAATLKTQRDTEAFRIKATKDTLNVLMSLSDTFAGESEEAQRRAFERNKAIATAQGLITTYESAIAAYRSQLTATPDSPIRAAIAAGIATAAGLANVAKIRKQKFQTSGGTDGGGDTGTRSATIPTPQEVGSDVGSLIPQGDAIDFTAPEVKPVQAFVISNEISNAQALDAELAIQSTL